MTTHYHLFDTDFGMCAIAWNDVGLTRVQLPEATPADTEARMRRGGATRWEGGGATRWEGGGATRWEGGGAARWEGGGAERCESGLPKPAEQSVGALRRYFAGDGADLAALNLDFGIVSDFNATIYRALRVVPRGATVTYGHLAKQIGSPGAARAVGMAMGRNPWPVIVPCHRVLAASEKMGGFSAPGGTVTKERLLALEGVAVGGTPMFPGFLRDRR